MSIVTIIGTPRATDGALAAMRTSPHNHPTTRWAVYQNHDLSHHEIGALRFLAVGPNNTMPAAPVFYPDSHLGPGWRYVHVGFLNLDSNTIDTEGSA